MGIKVYFLCNASSLASACYIQHYDTFLLTVAVTIISDLVISFNIPRIRTSDKRFKLSFHVSRFAEADIHLRKSLKDIPVSYLSCVLLTN